MRKLLPVSIVVLVALAVFVVPAFAITGNWVKDFEHPFVGLVVYYDANGEFVWRCSGSLISPTKFVTAGHCSDTGEGAVSARVYFQQDAGANYDPALGRSGDAATRSTALPARGHPAPPRTTSTTTASPTSPASPTRMTPAW